MKVVVHLGRHSFGRVRLTCGGEIRVVSEGCKQDPPFLVASLQLSRGFCLSDVSPVSPVSPVSLVLPLVWPVGTQATFR